MLFFGSNIFTLSKTVARSSWRSLLILGIALLCGLSIGVAPAVAGLNDDHFDGNIFPLYAGNGSLVPPRVRMNEALTRDRPAILFFYLDDSKDCKQFVPVISQIDAYYGRAADIIPVSVDTIPSKETYQPAETGYYFKGKVPQTVILDASNTIVLDKSGIVPFETIDDVLRDVFDLLPRSESVELKRRVVNEISTELVNE